MHTVCILSARGERASERYALELLLAAQPSADLDSLRGLAIRDRPALRELLHSLGITKIGQRLRVEAALLAAAEERQLPSAAKEPPLPSAAQQLASPLPVARGACDAASSQSLPLVHEANYLRLDHNYPGLRKLRSGPPMYACDSFLSPSECDELVRLASPLFGRSRVQGGDLRGRTSATTHLVSQPGCVQALLSRVARLTQQPHAHLEMVQVTRYTEGQQYVEHYDGEPNTSASSAFLSNGGQRVCTVLLYLNDVAHGGATAFPRLDVRVQPCKGRAIVFFPGTLDGELDMAALHAALPAVDTKFVSQVWVRQRPYDAEGQASSPLAQALLASLRPG